MNWILGPAHVVWSNHLGAAAMYSRAWRALQPRFGVQSESRSGKARLPTKELFHNNSYAHDDQADNLGQEIEGSKVSSPL